jgi:sulfite reductase (NADPH) flavoprotein alpha-component
VCPTCLSYGQFVDTGRPEEDVVAAAKPKKEAPAFHDETIPLPKRMEMAKDGDLFLKLYAAMAQTDCTACGYDCEGYAKALSNGAEKNFTLCVPGKQETEDVLKNLLVGAGLAK